MIEPSLSRKENDFINKQRKVLIIAVICVVTLFVGSSYALLTNFDTTNNVVSVSTGNLNMSISNATINLSSKYPISDEDGLATTPIEITLSNTGSLPIGKYVVSLINDTTQTTTLSHDYIKVAISDDNTNYSTPATLTSLNDVIYTGYELASASSVTLKLKIWISSTAGNASLGKTFYGAISVGLFQRDDRPTGVDAEGFIASNYTTGATSGLVAINTDGGLYNGTGTIREYRYSGVDSRWSDAEGTVKNYITFNNEMWRIVGIFKGDTDDGANAWNIKIVRDYPIGSYDGTNDTIQVPSSYASTGASTKTLASGTYSISASGSYPAFTAQRMYWNSGGTNSGYAYPSKSGILLWLNEYENTGSWYYQNYTSPGSNSAYKDFIATTIFYTRAGNHNTTVANEYNLERTTGTIYNNEPTYTGKIGLLHISDYAYASASSIWNGTSTTMNNYSSTGGLSSNKLNNWILKPNDNAGNYWFITPYVNDSRVLFWKSDGRVGSDSAINMLTLVDSNFYCIRPVLNLKSDTLLTGTGTYDDPYTIVPTSISLSSDSGTVGVGSSKNITVNTLAEGQISCLSSNVSIGTCSVSGNTVTINGVAEGNATITISQAAGTTLSTTYDLNVSLIACPGEGCYYTWTSSLYYTTWNTSGQTPTTINPNSLPNGVSTNYNDVVAYNIFLAVRLNSNNQVEHAYACGLVGGTTPFCIEGTYISNSNKELIQQANLNILTPIFNSCSGSVGSDISCSGSGFSEVYSSSLGAVGTHYSAGDECYVSYEGRLWCSHGGSGI